MHAHRTIFSHGRFDDLRYIAIEREVRSDAAPDARRQLRSPIRFLRHKLENRSHPGLIRQQRAPKLVGILSACVRHFIEIQLLQYKPEYTWPGLIIVLLGVPCTPCGGASLI